MRLPIRSGNTCSIICSGFSSAGGIANVNYSARESFGFGSWRVVREWDSGFTKFATPSI
jgi:hypothetical protein